VDSPIPQAVAPSAGLPANRRTEAHVVASASAKHDKCTPLPAPVVETKPLFLSNHEMTALCIVRIVISPVRLGTPIVANHAGNADMPDDCSSEEAV
jgi:hypothetical protein